MANEEGDPMVRFTRETMQHEVVIISTPFIFLYILNEPVTFIITFDSWKLIIINISVFL